MMIWKYISKILAKISFFAKRHRLSIMKSFILLFLLPVLAMTFKEQQQQQYHHYICPSDIMFFALSFTTTIFCSLQWSWLTIRPFGLLVEVRAAGLNDQVPWRPSVMNFLICSGKQLEPNQKLMEPHWNICGRRRKKVRRTKKKHDILVGRRVNR